MTRSPLLTLAILAAVATACSSSTSLPGTQTDAATHDAHSKDASEAGKSHPQDATPADTSMGVSDAKPDVINDPNNCVAPGTTSNVEGVGGYCSPKGGQCAHALAGGLPSICTADLAGTPVHDWFCTVSCSKTSDCGSGAIECVATNDDQECIPTACIALIGDAALPDATADAPLDAPRDAAKTDGGKPDGQASDAAIHDAAPVDAQHDQ